MNDRLIAANESSDDPLGRPPKAPQIGRQRSPFKKHLSRHGKKWAIACGVGLSLALTAFLAWTINVSIRTYAQRRPPAAPTLAMPELPARPSRAIDGAVQVELEVGRLVTTERVLVLRDMGKIIRDRLRDQGIPVAVQSANRLHIQFDEYPGEPVSLVRPVEQGAEVTGQIPTNNTFIQATLETPQGSVPLGQKTITSGLSSIEIEGNGRSERSQQTNRLRQLVYTDSLDFLRKVDLPVPKR